MKHPILCCIIFLSVLLGEICAHFYSDEDYTGEGSYANDVFFSEDTNFFDDESWSSVERFTSVNSPSKPRKLSSPEECARTCVVGEDPKTCYYHFTLENYGTLTRACDSCLPNVTRLTEDCQCITADGFEMSGIQVANRMYPGPSIMACLHDYVVVDVKNRLHGSAVTIHWHGIFQNGHQYYDGVPYVTQCPIQEGTTFRYQWRADNAGTHFWHSHSGFQKSNGLTGAVIVRQPKINEPFNELWDHDDLDNVIFISDWLHDLAESHFPGNLRRNTRQRPDNFLVNGMGQWWDPATGNFTQTPLATFNVKKGSRYRFRMINGCTLNCPVQLTIQGHNLTVIATDGVPVVPVPIDSITSFSAERYDFVLNANQTADSYWIQIRGLGECEDEKIQQLAVLRYDSVTYDLPQGERPSYDAGIDAGIVLNQINVPCKDATVTNNVVCVSQLESANPVPERILQEPDIRLFFPFGFYLYESGEVFEPGTYKEYIVPLAVDEVVSLVGEKTINVLPSAPLISQRAEIDQNQICTLDQLPAICEGKQVCPCSLVEEIPLNSVVEIIIVDATNSTDNLAHTFHLHGGIFYVMSDGIGKDYNISVMDLRNAKELHRLGKMVTNHERPPAKDSYTVYTNGFAVIRFVADNPGYWFFHCHFMFHLTAGMAATFHVGEPSDLPPIPRGFPVCRNFLPSINDGRYSGSENSYESRFN